MARSGVQRDVDFIQVDTALKLMKTNEVDIRNFPKLDPVTKTTLANANYLYYTTMRRVATT